MQHFPCHGLVLSLSGAVTSLVCNVAPWMGSSRFPGVSSPVTPTGASSGFHISGHKGAWQISCSHCLSSSQLFTFMDFSGFSLERDSGLLLSLFLHAISGSSKPWMYEQPVPIFMCPCCQPGFKAAVLSRVIAGHCRYQGLS